VICVEAALAAGVVIEAYFLTLFIFDVSLNFLTPTMDQIVSLMTAHVDWDKVMAGQYFYIYIGVNV
jgi:hypothetical protein